MQAMQRAVELAPFDLGLRIELSQQQARQGQLAAARANLLPVAYNPHGGELAEKARAALAGLDAVLGSQARSSGGVSDKPAAVPSVSAARSQPDPGPPTDH
jgi:hypothetical protein